MTGALPRSAELTIAQLEALGGEDVTATFREQTHVYRAVGVDHLLLHLGFEPGAGGKELAPKQRRPGWRKLVVARALDGFVAVFTAAELMPGMGPSRVHVAWRRDGEPLPPDEGPLRLLVPTDAKGSRAARHLRELEVVELPAR